MLEWIHLAQFMLPTLAPNLANSVFNPHFTQMAQASSFLVAKIDPEHLSFHAHGNNGVQDAGQRQQNRASCRQVAPQTSPCPSACPKPGLAGDEK